MPMAHGKAILARSQAVAGLLPVTGVASVGSVSMPLPVPAVPTHPFDPSMTVGHSASYSRRSEERDVHRSRARPFDQLGRGRRGGTRAGRRSDPPLLSEPAPGTEGRRWQPRRQAAGGGSRRVAPAGEGRKEGLEGSLEGTRQTMRQVGQPRNRQREHRHHSERRHQEDPDSNPSACGLFAPAG